jgi:hypothetical protein
MSAMMRRDLELSSDLIEVGCRGEGEKTREPGWF